MFFFAVFLLDLVMMRFFLFFFFPILLTSVSLSFQDIGRGGGQKRVLLLLLFFFPIFEALKSCRLMEQIDTQVTLPACQKLPDLKAWRNFIGIKKINVHEQCFNNVRSEKKLAFWRTWWHLSPFINFPFFFSGIQVFAIGRPLFFLVVGKEEEDVGNPIIIKLRKRGERNTTPTFCPLLTFITSLSGDAFQEINHFFIRRVFSKCKKKRA